MIMIMMINAQSIDIIDQWVDGGYTIALTERNGMMMLTYGSTS